MNIPFPFLILHQPSVSPLLLMRLKQRKRTFIRTEDKADLPFYSLPFTLRWQKTDGGVIAEALSTSLCPFFASCSHFGFVCVFRRKRTKQCYRRRCSTSDRTTCGCRRRARRRRLSSGSSQSGSFTPLTRNPEAQTQVLGGEHPSLIKTFRWSTNKSPSSTVIKLLDHPFAFETAGKAGFLGSSSVWNAWLFLAHALHPGKQAAWETSPSSTLGAIMKGVPQGPLLSPWNLFTGVECKAHLL